MSIVTPAALEEAVLETLYDQLKSGETPTPIAVITAAIAFLKAFPPDHEEPARSDSLSPTLQKLANKMPFSGLNRAPAAPN